MSPSRFFRSPFRLLALTGALLVSLLASGCIMHHARQHEAGSIVQFLYPDQNQPVIEPRIPILRLPLRVGVAFVPPGRHGDARYAARTQFSEAQKTVLLREVAAAFKTLPFIQSIDIVPTTYLRPGGGFDNLDQLRALMGVDVIALVSYDQVQNSDETPWSLAYWTIVGAYLIPAQRNETHTLVEAVVYDIASRSLLFRAPGVSAVKGHSTYIQSDTDLRADSARGFTEASADMTKNLHTELAAFKVRAKEEPEKIRIEHRPGYTGGGALGGGFAGALLLLVAVRRLFIRR